MQACTGFVRSFIDLPVVGVDAGWEVHTLSSLYSPFRHEFIVHIDGNT